MPAEFRCTSTLTQQRRYAFTNIADLYGMEKIYPSLRPEKSRFY
jgi:hypothetical protein